MELKKLLTKNLILLMYEPINIIKNIIMLISNKTVWVIMSKDRKVIGKGTPRNRELILVSDTKDKKRLLTYSSKGMAEAGFKHSFFSQYRLKEQKEYTVDDMEAVAVQMEITTLFNEF